jgi:hypothetical protein
VKVFADTLPPWPHHRGRTSVGLMIAVHGDAGRAKRERTKHRFLLFSAIVKKTQKERKKKKANER